MNASDVMNGSSHPAMCGTRSRWPDEEIGRNSVSPCTIPMTMAWKTVSIESHGGPTALARPAVKDPP